MLGREIRGVDADIVVGITHDVFLTPIAEDVALKAGRALCVVVGLAALKDGDAASRGLKIALTVFLPLL